MHFAMLWPVALVILAAIILFSDRLKATWIIVLVFGIGYYIIGAYRTGAGSRPSRLADPWDVSFMWHGLGLVVFALLLMALWWFRDIRRRMPRR